MTFTHRRLQANKTRFFFFFKFVVCLLFDDISHPPAYDTHTQARRHIFVTFFNVSKLLSRLTHWLIYLKLLNESYE